MRIRALLNRLRISRIERRLRTLLADNRTREILLHLILEHPELRAKLEKELCRHEDSATPGAKIGEGIGMIINHIIGGRGREEARENLW